MADVYIEVAAGNASGGDVGEAQNPYHWPDDKASAESAAGEGGRVLMLDGTYTSFSGLGGTIDDITWEAVNPTGAIISGIGVAANADAEVKINKCKCSGSINLNFTNAADLTMTLCDWTTKPSNQSDEGTLKFVKCRFPYGYYFSVGNNTNHVFEKSTIYQPTTSRLNGNNQNCRVDKCIIAVVSAYNQGGDLDWYGAGSNNWVYNWTGYDTNDAWVDGDTDPLFRDAANGDVRLRPNSPCVGKLFV